MDGTLIERIRSAYLEMPGLCLTLEQAQRLFGIERVVCQEAFDALVEMGFLCLTTTRRYARHSSEGTVRRQSPSVHTVQLRVKLDRRQLPGRRLILRGGRRATDVESARHSEDNGLRTARAL
jgi:hypothetical protein